ncbi:MAG: hypothetical protein ACYCQJ_12970 [Nitrososphaerales archaeon]
MSIRRFGSRIRGKIFYGPTTVGILFVVVITNIWVALAAAAGPTGNSLASNFLDISYVYLIFGVLAMVLLFAPFTGFSYRRTSPAFMMTEYAIGGLFSMFAIVAVTGLIESASPFSIFVVAAQSAGGTNAFSTVSLITNPAFYAIWIFANGAAEEGIMLPMYAFFTNIGGSSPSSILVSNGITGSAFSILHYVKETIIYGPNLPPAAWFFIFSAFFVRIALNLLMSYSHMVAPSMIAHGGFDFILTVAYNIQI